MNVCKLPFVPYASEAEVIEIDGLTIENRLDRITLSGDLDLTRDKVGLEKARLLHQVLEKIVATLEAEPLPDRLPEPPVSTVGNPFD